MRRSVPALPNPTVLEQFLLVAATRHGLPAARRFPRQLLPGAHLARLDTPSTVLIGASNRASGPVHKLPLQATARAASYRGSAWACAPIPAGPLPAGRDRVCVPAQTFSE